MHLRVIIPLVGDQFTELVRKEVSLWTSSETTTDIVTLERGTASIESEYDEALAAPGILDRVREAAADGVDAVFVSCFGDPAVHPAREIIDAPVVGGYEPAMLTALSLGDKVGIVTVLPNVLGMLHSLERRYAIDRRVGAIRVVDLPVLALEDHDLLTERLFEQSAEIVRAGQADVIVLGCTGMIGVARALQEKLAAAGLPVPVVDPTGAAIGWLQMCSRLGVTPSRTTYMPPPEKMRNI